MSLLPWCGSPDTESAAAHSQRPAASRVPHAHPLRGASETDRRPDAPEMYAGRAAARTLEQKHERNCGLKTEFDAAVLRVFQIGEQLRSSIRDTVESAGKTLVHLEQTTDAVRKVKQFYDVAFDEKADGSPEATKPEGGSSP